LASNLLPVLIKLSVDDKVVEIFVFLSFLKWENTLDDNEKDDTSREHIDLLSVVGLALLDFWSHIGHGTSVGLKLVDFLVSGKAEISNFEVHIVVNQNVLELQISVNNTFSLHVTENFAHLMEEISAIVFSHSTDGLADIEQEATSDVFKEDVNEVGNFSTRWFFDVSI
jgi:hypothetical protein